MFDYFVNLIKSNKLVQNSAIFFIGTMLYNFGNYLYHLLMARMLTVSEYGEIQSLLSIYLILGIPLLVILTVMVKYSAGFKGEGRLDKIYSLFKYFTRKLFILGVAILLLMAIFSGYLAKFLQLSSPWPVILLGLGVVGSFTLLPTRAILQGMQKFVGLSINNIIEVSFKIIGAVVFVFLGWRVNGAVGGIFIGLVIAYLFSFLPIRFIFKYRREHTELETKEIFKYSAPVLITFLVLTLFYTIDVILVKHFFPPELAGHYGGISILGRIIFFVAGPIIAVMFAMISEAQTQGTRGEKKIFYQTFFLVSLSSLLIMLVYFVVPQLVIKILLGSDFLPIAGYLGWFALAMLFYTLVNLFAQYFLAINKTKFTYFLIAGVIVQIVLISIWHTTIMQVIGIVNIVWALVLLLFLVYYFKARKDSKKLLNYV